MAVLQASVGPARMRRILCIVLQQPHVLTPMKDKCGGVQEGRIET